MSHEITETDEMAYVGKTPWHGLGNSLPEGADVETMANAANLTWRVDKKKLRVVDGKTVNGHYGLVRSDTGDTLDVVGRQYIPTQPREALEFFERFAQAGELTMDTAGSLSGGRWVWGLARINGAKDVTDGDALRNYVLLVSPNVHGKSLLVKQTSVRVVCWNTLTCAMGRGENATWSMRHTRAFDEVARNEAQLVVGNATKMFSTFVDDARAMSKIPLTHTGSMDYLKRVFHIDEVSLAARKEVDADAEAKVRRSPLITRFETALTSAPGAQLAGAKDTLWGAFNAVTYLCDHALGRDADTRLRESWLGYREDFKHRGLALAHKMVEHHS